MKRTYKKNKTIKMSKTRIMIFFTFITSIIVLSISSSKYQSLRESQSSGRVAKWDIDLSTDYNSYVLFENAQENSQDFTVTVTSESEVSSKYDIELDDIYKVYNAKLSGDGYEVGYSFGNNTLTIKNNNDSVEFNTTNNSQIQEVNGNNYQMEKYTSAGRTYINITNNTTNKEIIELITDNNNGLKVLFKNCKEYISTGKHEDTYNLRLSTQASDLPKECNLKLYAIFEQID